LFVLLEVLVVSVDVLGVSVEAQVVFVDVLFVLLEVLVVSVVILAVYVEVLVVFVNTLVLDLALVTVGIEVASVTQKLSGFVAGVVSHISVVGQTGLGLFFAFPDSVVVPAVVDSEVVVSEVVVVEVLVAEAAEVVVEVVFVEGVVEVVVELDPVSETVVAGVLEFAFDFVLVVVPVSPSRDFCLNTQKRLRDDYLTKYQSKKVEH